MHKIRKPRYNVYEVTLTEQLPHKDYMWRYYMDGDEMFSSNQVLRFNAVDVAHAMGLLAKTQYEGNIKLVRAE